MKKLLLTAALFALPFAASATTWTETVNLNDYIGPNDSYNMLAANTFDLTNNGFVVGSDVAVGYTLTFNGESGAGAIAASHGATNMFDAFALSEMTQLQNSFTTTYSLTTHSTGLNRINFDGSMSLSFFGLQNTDMFLGSATLTAWDNQPQVVPVPTAGVLFLTSLLGLTLISRRGNR